MSRNADIAQKNAKSAPFFLRVFIKVKCGKKTVISKNHALLPSLFFNLRNYYRGTSKKIPFLPDASARGGGSTPSPAAKNATFFSSNKQLKN